MVLRAASEIDESRGSVGRGLSVEDLQDIASEVGISPEAISQAVGRLDRGGRDLGSLLQGAPAVHKAVHAVHGELNKEALAQLIRLIDEKTDSAGTISEALGSVRWTAGDRFHSMHVSLTPGNDETVIQVVEKAPRHLRRVVQLMPAAWGAMIAGAVVAGADPTGVGIALAIVAGVLGGGGLGRLVWSRVSARTGKRVEKLAAELSRHAYDASKKGLVVPKDGRTPG